jgi:hypothetical protein
MSPFFVANSLKGYPERIPGNQATLSLFFGYLKAACG